MLTPLRSFPHRLEGFPQGSCVPGPCCGAVSSALLQCGLAERYLSRQTEDAFDAGVWRALSMSALSEKALSSQRHCDRSSRTSPARRATWGGGGGDGETGKKAACQVFR